MKPPALGTILPTRESLAADERHYREQQAIMEHHRRTAPELQGLTRRTVGREVRFYASESLYALVSQSHKPRVLWFHRRADGEWYSGKTPPPGKK